MENTSLRVRKSKGERDEIRVVGGVLTPKKELLDISR